MIVAFSGDIHCAFVGNKIKFQSRFYEVTIYMTLRAISNHKL